MSYQETLHYKDVTLIPNECIVKSRSECDTSIDFCGHRFDLSVTPSNMQTVISEDNAKWMAFNNLFYIYHRFSDTRKFIQRARAEAWPLVSISVGVKDEDKELIQDIANSKCRVHFVCIDIAHGHSKSTVEMIKYIRENLPETKVIAGNVWGHRESINFLQDVGAHAIKIGLSMGLGCSTFNETGFGSPMFTAALEAGRYAKVPVILDGGIRQNGDVAKATVAFTSVQGQYTYGGMGTKIFPDKLNIPMVMAGSIFSACIDSPGENSYGTEIDDALKEFSLSEIEQEIGKRLIIKYKKYYGSASADSKRNTGQEVKHVEGKTVLLECNNLTYEQKFSQIKGAIQSQISYAGGKDLSALKDVKWMTVRQ